MGITASRRLLIILMSLTAVVALHSLGDDRQDDKLGDRLDLSTPQAMVKSFLTAWELGDAEALKACSTRPLNPEVLETKCAEKKSLRAFQAAGAKLWAVPHPTPTDFLQPPRTCEQWMKENQKVVDQASFRQEKGPSAVLVSASWFSFAAQRGTDGKWKLDATLMFDSDPARRPGDSMRRRGLLQCRIQNRVRDEVTKEILAQKYADFTAAQRALDARTRKALEEDADYQAALHPKNGK